MPEQSFKFTKKDLIKLSIMMVLATFLFGLPGLMIMLFFQWVTNQSYAVETAQKHGISKTHASRFGGAAIFLCASVLFIFGSYLGLLESGKSQNTPLVAWITVVVCMSLGLADDFSSNLISPKIRLISISVIFALCLALTPSLIPVRLGVMPLDYLLSAPFIGWLITVIFCAGFVNAVNMADGANGLIPGTITIAFSVFYMEAGLTVYAILMVSCGLFAMFNVISGRLFLGDAGAYGLGSIIVLNGLYQFSEGVFSAAFLAALFAYPCIDILATVIRRKIRGRSIFLPDNDHLHNRVHYHFQLLFKSKTLANSLTGLAIVSCSSGMALLGYSQNWWPVVSDKWIWVFFVQCTLYLVSFILLGLRRPVSQFVVNE